LRKNGATPRSAGQLDDDISLLSGNETTEAVTEYGNLGTKIESLAVLRKAPGVMAEVARLSLSRTYVDRCVARGGDWTSGVHLYWWTREQMTDEPEVRAEDIRVETRLSLARQVDIAKWAVVMLRLVFMSDIGHHASNHSRLAALRRMPERAAESTASLSFGKLIRWVRKEGIKIADQALSKKRYVTLARELHKQRDA
jgi:hypothetical protein